MRLLFPQTKSVLKRTQFMSVEEAKAKKMDEAPEQFTDKDLHHCLQQWQHCMQLCLNTEGDYFEADHKRLSCIKYIKKEIRA